MTSYLYTFFAVDHNRRFPSATTYTYRMEVSCHRLNDAFRKHLRYRIITVMQAPSSTNMFAKKKLSPINLCSGEGFYLASATGAFSEWCNDV